MYVEFFNRLVMFVLDLIDCNVIEEACTYSQTSARFTFSSFTNTPVVNVHIILSTFVPFVTSSNVKQALEIDIETKHLVNHCHRKGIDGSSSIRSLRPKSHGLHPSP